MDTWYSRGFRLFFCHCWNFFRFLLTGKFNNNNLLTRLIKRQTERVCIRGVTNFFFEIENRKEKQPLIENQKFLRHWYVCVCGELKFKIFEIR